MLFSRVGDVALGNDLDAFEEKINQSNAYDNYSEPINNNNGSNANGERPRASLNAKSH